MAQIESGASSDKWTINPTSKGGRAELYDFAGNPIGRQDRSAITPGSLYGFPIIGTDYKLGRTLRTFSDGALAAANPSLLLFDNVEGAAYNSNTWLQALSTMTVTQATGVITFNAASSTASGAGAMHTSHRPCQLYSRSRLLMRARQRHTAHSNNNLIEVGFGSGGFTVATASFGSGAVWRKDGSGQYVPVISSNGSEILGTPISNATWVAACPATDFVLFEVEMEPNRATFRALTNAGVLINEQILDFTGTTADYSLTHFYAFYRTYNNAATGAAVQLLTADVAVYLLDVGASRSWRDIAGGAGFGPITSPTAYTQLANYTNNTAPTTRTLSNTAAGETTLGGLLSAAAMAGGETDLIMFGFTVPTPYMFYCTGITIPPPVNLVAAVAGTPTTFTYGAAFNSSAVSLATAGTYPPMRIALPGAHTAAVALGIGGVFSGNNVTWTPQVPVPCYGTRFLHVFCRALAGTATATEVFRWNVTIDGYFE